MYDSNIIIENAKDILEDKHFSIGYRLRCNTILFENIYEEKDLCENDYYKDYTLEIYASGDETTELIGEITFKIFNIDLIDELGEVRFDVFDCIDDEYSELGYILENSNELNHIYNSCSYVLYLEKIIINKEFRNHGIGSKSIRDIEKILLWFLNFYPEIVLLKSYPIEYQAEHSDVRGKDEQYWVEFKRLNENLNRMYSKCNFKKITNGESTYFYRIC